MHRFDSDDTDAYSLLAPGLLHQFGNLFLTIQGTALTLDAGNMERSRKVMLNANDRGCGSLLILRVLLGEPVHRAVDAKSTLESVLELCRVSLRERGQTVELRASAPTDHRVDFGSFVRTVVECVRLVSAAVPDGVHGGLLLTLRPAETGACLRLGCRFQAVAGTLPFPLPTAAIGQSVTRRLAGQSIAVDCTADAMGIELVLTSFPTGQAQQA